MTTKYTLVVKEDCIKIFGNVPRNELAGLMRFAKALGFSEIKLMREGEREWFELVR